MMAPTIPSKGTAAVLAGVLTVRIMFVALDPLITVRNITATFMVLDVNDIILQANCAKRKKRVSGARPSKRLSRVNVTGVDTPNAPCVMIGSLSMTTSVLTLQIMFVALDPLIIVRNVTATSMVLDVNDIILQANCAKRKKRVSGARPSKRLSRVNVTGVDTPNAPCVMIGSL